MRAARAWQQFGELAPQKVLVHFSRREIADHDLDASLAAAITTHGLLATNLGLEIVENDFNDSILLPQLAEHQDRGFPLAVEDFGTGYSSLARLVNFPVQYAKIDRSFVVGLRDATRLRTLIETIVVIALHLDVTVVAEGIETQHQVIDLTSIGCDLAPGISPRLLPTRRDHDSPMGDSVRPRHPIRGPVCHDASSWRRSGRPTLACTSRAQQARPRRVVERLSLDPSPGSARPKSA